MAAAAAGSRLKGKPDVELIFHEDTSTACFVSGATDLPKSHSIKVQSLQPIS